MRMLTAIVAIGVTAFSGLAIAADATTRPAITLSSLLDEMIDLRALAEFPSPAYRTLQASSYDRASKSPDDPKTWFANADAGQYIRDEDNNGRVEHVLMDARGPGAVVRIWSADPKGTLRIYLDDSPQPTIEGPMSELLSGVTEGMPAPIAAMTSKGYSSYYPIPFAKSCKITCDAHPIYYHVNYRVYEAGTAVQTLSMEQVRAEARHAWNVAAKLSEQITPSRGDTKDASNFDTEIPPGAIAEVAAFDGPAAVNLLSLSCPGSGNLSRTVLIAEFDGVTTIEAPLLHFFGAGGGADVPFHSEAFGVGASETLHSCWLMPFAKSARIRIRNVGDRSTRVDGRAMTTQYTWSPRSMHLHATFRRARDLPTRPMIDWNYLTAAGRGVFAGSSLVIDNPVKAWWGEGDEKFYVDGEKFPSWFGTGTEDYFGYAWCCPVPFTHAYHSQPRCDGPGNYGRTSVNRLHIMDRVPFEKSFKFDMELWHWADCKVQMAATTFWYALPGGMDDRPPLSNEDAIDPPAPPPFQPMRVAGAIEGETMTVKSLPAGTIASPQEWAGLSNERQLWWRQNTRIGDELVLNFVSPVGGRHRVHAKFLRASDYGIVKLRINDQPAGKPVDLFSSTVAPSDEMDLGELELRAGENELKVIIVGQNDKSKDRLFGLDYLRLD